MRRDWLLAVAAPAAVALGLVGFGDVWVVFLVYHVGLCLLAPVLMAWREGLTPRRWRERVGLGREALGRSLVLGVALVVIPPVAYALAPGLFPDRILLEQVLTAWGVDPARPEAVLLFLALVNGPAEELLWRGHLQTRLLQGPVSAVALVLLFSSYHALTVGELAPGPVGVAVMLAGVVAAAAFWVWSRRRWNSLWPALLSHAGASLGYVLVCWRILQG